MDTVENIKSYWGVQPPHKSDSVTDRFSLSWYQGISEHRYRLVPYMKGFVGFERSEGKRVLEIGCGAGTDLAEFARHGAEVVGLDVTDIAIEMTRKRFEAEGLNGTFIKYDGESLPADLGTFDLVYSWGVLHHTPMMEDILVEAHAKLNAGGELVLMLYNRYSAIYYYSILYLRKHLLHPELSRQEALSRFSEFREGCPYTRVYAAEEMRNLLWYFSEVEASVEYPVYDGAAQRKIPLGETFDVESTGMADVDRFIADYNRSAVAGEDLARFGWHLVVRARK